MPNNIPISLGSGASLATDQVGGLHYPYTKVADGTAGNENYWTIGSDGSGQVALKGNVTIDSLPNVTIGSALPAGTNAIGKLAANSGVDIGDVDVTSNTAWSDPNTFIGLATVEVANTVTVDLGSNNDVTVTGNVTLSDSKGFIGLVSVSGFTSPLAVDATGQGDVPVTLDGETVTIGAALPAGDNNIGNVDIASSLPAGTNAIGKLAANSGVDIGDVDVTSNTAWSDPNTFIGLATVEVANSVGVSGNVTVSISGPAQTIVPHSIKLSTSSIATIAVPTNTFKVTSLLLNSDATVRVSVKSGATYLTGNASIGIVLNPGGGFVKDGTVDSPSFTGLADAEALVVEKFDMTATAANVGGYVSYYED